MRFNPEEMFTDKQYQKYAEGTARKMAELGLSAEQVEQGLRHFGVDFDRVDMTKVQAAVEEGITNRDPALQERLDQAEMDATRDKTESDKRHADATDNATKATQEGTQEAKRT